MHEPADTGCQSLILLAFSKICASRCANKRAAKAKPQGSPRAGARALQSLREFLATPLQLADIEGGTVGAVARSRVISG